MRQISSRPLAYGIAILAVAVAALIKWLMGPVAWEKTPFLLMFVAITVSAWCGGLWPGIFATVLSAMVVGWFFVPPVGAFPVADPGQAFQVGLFLFEGAVISGLCELLHRMRQRAERLTRLLRGARTFQDSVAQTLHEPLVLLDPELRVVRVNPAFCDTFKMERHEVENRRFFEIGAGEWDRPDVRETFKQARGDDSKPQQAEFEAEFAGAGRKIVSCHIQRLADESQETDEILLLIEDVTARRDARRKIAESEARKTAILEAALDAIITIDHEGRVIEANSATRSIFGYSHEEMIGREMAELIVPPHLREAHRRGMQRFLETGEGPVLGKRLELPAVRADGTEFPVELAITLIKTEGMPMFTGYLRDITERKAAEAAAAERTRLSAMRAEIAGLLAGTQPLDETLQQCCAKFTEHLDVAFARIWTMNTPEKVLELRASAGIYTHLDGDHSRVPLGELKIGRIAKNQQPHLTNDVPNDPNISDPEWAKREGMVGFAGYPLMVGGRVLGVLAMFSRHEISEAVLAELAPISNTLAQCIERKRAGAARAAAESPAA